MRVTWNPHPQLLLLQQMMSHFLTLEIQNIPQSDQREVAKIENYNFYQVKCIIGNGHMGPPLNRQTDTSENITFLQLHQRAVMIWLWQLFYLMLCMGVSGILIYKRVKTNKCICSILFLSYLMCSAAIWKCFGISSLSPFHRNLQPCM